MSTCSFNGTTFWNSATTGVGEVVAITAGKRREKQFEQITRGNGVIEKQMTTLGADVVVLCQFVGDTTARASVESTLGGLISSQGTLSLTRSRSWTYCSLVNYEIRDGATKLDPPSSVVYDYMLVAIFKQVRV